VFIKYFIKFLFLIQNIIVQNIFVTKPCDKTCTYVFIQKNQKVYINLKKAHNVLESSVYIIFHFILINNGPKLSVSRVTLGQILELKASHIAVSNEVMITDEEYMRNYGMEHTQNTGVVKVYIKGSPVLRLNHNGEVEHIEADWGYMSTMISSSVVGRYSHPLGEPQCINKKKKTCQSVSQSVRLSHLAILKSSQKKPVSSNIMTFCKKNIYVTQPVLSFVFKRTTKCILIKQPLFTIYFNAVFI
jgi:hypothetical protein